MSGFGLPFIILLRGYMEVAKLQELSNSSMSFDMNFTEKQLELSWNMHLKAKAQNLQCEVKGCRESHRLCESERIRSSSNNLTFLSSLRSRERSMRGIWVPDINSSDTGILSSPSKGRESKLLFYWDSYSGKLGVHVSEGRVEDETHLALWPSVNCGEGRPLSKDMMLWKALLVTLWNTWLKCQREN